MKKNHVYDNTKIVVVSDHGIRGPVADRSTRARKGKTTDNRFVRSRSTLFVKEVGEHGQIRVSEEFLPNAEVPEIVCKEIGGCTNPYLDNKPITHEGNRMPFVVTFVPWQFTMQNIDAFRILEADILVEPSPYDLNSWKINVQPQNTN